MPSPKRKIIDRGQGHDRPAMLELIFTNNIDDIKDFEYSPLLGESDQKVLQ